MSISGRLREERKRLKRNQTELAELVGITKKAQVDYEKDRLPQFANYLESIAKAGVDVGYVITGEHGGVHLTPEESEFLALMRKAAPEVRATALGVLRSGMVISKQVHVGRDHFGDIKI